MAFTRVKIAVFAPMPRAMVRMTVAAKLGDFWTWRRANLRFDMASGWTNERWEGKQTPPCSFARPSGGQLSVVSVTNDLSCDDGGGRLWRGSRARIRGRG